MHHIQSPGNQVFITEDIQINWDGTSAGKTLPEGVYFYMIRAFAVKGEKPEKQEILHLNEIKSKHDNEISFN